MLKRPAEASASFCSSSALSGSLQVSYNPAKKFQQGLRPLLYSKPQAEVVLGVEKQTVGQDEKEAAEHTPARALGSCLGPLQTRSGVEPAAAAVAKLLRR